VGESRGERMRCRMIREVSGERAVNVSSRMGGVGLGYKERSNKEIILGNRAGRLRDRHAHKDSINKTKGGIKENKERCCLVDVGGMPVT